MPPLFHGSKSRPDALLGPVSPLRSPGGEAGVDSSTPECVYGCSYYRFTVRSALPHAFALTWVTSVEPGSPLRPFPPGRIGFESTEYSGCTEYSGSPVAFPGGCGVAASLRQKDRRAQFSPVTCPSFIAFVKKLHDPPGTEIEMWHDTTACMYLGDGEPVMLSCGGEPNNPDCGTATVIGRVVLPNDEAPYPGCIKVALTDSGMQATSVIVGQYLSSSNGGNAGATVYVTPMRRRSVNIHAEALPEHCPICSWDSPVLEPTWTAATGVINPRCPSHGSLVLNRCCAIGPIVSAYSPHVAPPSYILLRIGSVPGASTTVQSRYGDHTTIVTGKIVLGDQLVVQRHTPLDVICMGTEVLDEVRIEFLNPNGSHYDFMGREHSIALVLNVPQDRVHSLIP